MCADVDSKSMCGKKTGVSLIAACKGGDALLDYLEGYHEETGFFKEVDHDQSM